MPKLAIERRPAGAHLFHGLTQDTVPPAARPFLEKAHEAFGFVPNLAVAMATVPPALEAYLHMLHRFGQTPLNAIEQQVVLMAVSRANGADYSLAVHAAMAANLGANAHVIKGVGTGGPVGDPKLSSLRQFTEALTLGRGRVSEDELDRFLAAGYDRAAVVSVAFGVAVKTFANTMAHLAESPVDEAFAPALASLREGVAVGF